MKLEQLYKDVTTDGLRSVLTTIRYIDDNTTIGQLREYLTKKVDTATKRESEELNRRALSFENKCFKVVYSPDNTTLFQVLEVKEDRSMGIEYKAIVNSICNYRGNVSIRENEEIGVFSLEYNESCVEILPMNLIASCRNIKTYYFNPHNSHDNESEIQKQLF